jgi:hypothetical protein
VTASQHAYILPLMLLLHTPLMITTLQKQQHKFEHLTCFFPGALALGSTTCADPVRAARDLQLAKVRPNIKCLLHKVFDVQQSASCSRHLQLKSKHCCTAVAASSRVCTAPYSVPFSAAPATLLATLLLMTSSNSMLKYAVSANTLLCLTAALACYVDIMRRH